MKALCFKNLFIIALAGLAIGILAGFLATTPIPDFSQTDRQSNYYHHDD